MGFKFEKRGVHETVLSLLFLNLGETAVFFKARPRFMVHIIENNTVSVKRTGSFKKRITVCVLVACDETRLHLFVTSNHEPSESSEKSLRSTLGASGFGYCHPKRRMDDSSMRNWIESVRKSYGSDHDRSVLLFDELSCRKQVTVLGISEFHWNTCKIYSRSYIRVSPVAREVDAAVQISSYGKKVDGLPSTEF